MACTGNNWYPDCQTVYDDCVAIYIETVLQTAANCSSVPLWPVSPSVGWASGVDTATGTYTYSEYSRLTVPAARSKREDKEKRLDFY